MTCKYDFCGSHENHYETHNPASPEQKVGRYSIPDETEIGRIIERANIAQEEWNKVPGLEKGLRLNEFLDAVVAKVDVIAESITLEQGKILAEAKGETLKGAAEGRFMVGEAGRVGAQSIANGRPDFANQILRRPRGVIFCISPWNFPAMTPLRKMCPAIAFGNAVIMKPSQFTPAANYLLADIAKDYFPEHLVQILMTGGRTASEVIANGQIQGVSFTGSVETGKQVYAAAAQNLIPVQLELGGKNGAILNDTHNLEDAVAKIAGAAFQTSGQRCTAISRVMVHSSLANETKELLVAAANRIQLGNGMEASSQMGPLCNFPHWQGVTDLTTKAIQEGAQPLAGGKPAAGAGDQGGYFYQPTILGNVEHQSNAAQVEIFGPVLSVLEYQNFDDAMAMLNGTEFGLTSAIFSDSNEKVQRFLRESQHGMMHVNHGSVPDNNMPFGGIKHSGVGPYSVGPTAANFYTSEHSAYITW